MGRKARYNKNNTQQNNKTVNQKKAEDQKAENTEVQKPQVDVKKEPINEILEKDHEPIEKTENRSESPITESPGKPSEPVITATESPISRKSSIKSNKTSSRNSSKSRKSSKSEKCEEEGRIRSSSTRSSSSSSENENVTDDEQPTNWWNLVNDIASGVSNVVVQGIKDEIQEIKEDIETVASVSVTAGQHIADYSSIIGEKAKENYKKAAESSTEFLKTDLAEFSKVLAEETDETVKDVKEVSNIIGETISDWAKNISAAATVGGTQTFSLGAAAASFTGTFSSSISRGFQNSANFYNSNSGKTNQKVNFASAFDARLHNLRTDTSTYCAQPEDEADYDLWRETFELDSQATKATISDLLVASQEVRNLYTKLVPSAVPHQEFWQRYFYRLDALERAERQRNAIMERAGKSEEEDEEDLSWGGDDEEEISGKEEKNVEKQVDDIQDPLRSDAEESVKDVKEEESNLNDVDEQEANKIKDEAEDEDWEKEFEMDMTADEIENALKNNDVDSDNLDDWE